MAASLTMRPTEERAAAQMLLHLLEAVDRGELTAETPAERRNARRLEGDGGRVGGYCVAAQA